MENITVQDLKAIKLALEKFIPHSSEEKEQADETLRKVKLILADAHTVENADGSKETVDKNQKTNKTRCLKVNLEGLDNKPKLEIVGINCHFTYYRTAYTQAELWEIVEEMERLWCSEIRFDNDLVKTLPFDDD